jgi:hypothetical protein
VPRRPPVALGVVLLAFLGSACSGSGTSARHAAAVQPVNGLSPQTLLRCRALKAALPAQLAQGVSSRAAEPESDTTAAWGDPAIALRCGVPRGSDRDDPYTFNGVTWAMHDTGASRTWTTTAQQVNVSVQVPDAYSSQAELVGTVSYAVLRARL